MCVGMDPAAAALCSWVLAARGVCGATCPACAGPLCARQAVALAPCRHTLHLHCLNLQLERLRAHQEPLYIECLVCGREYGRPPEPGAPADQPRGSMAWALQPVALPQHPPCTSSILVTYKYVSPCNHSHGMSVVCDSLLSFSHIL